MDGVIVSDTVFVMLEKVLQKNEKLSKIDDRRELTGKKIFMEG